MTVLLILLMFVAFVGLDFLVRDLSRRHRARKELEARRAVLETAVRLDFTHEAKSLKRVEVPEPRGRILAVDDEPVVLDSFRRILVLEGFSVDTVETGPEALGLVQRRDYDFVFTDLKMPGMDGVEVVKAVKHLRPDVDVVVITGYATIETAVETLQQGACEYVQKPFTAEELADFAKKLLIKRQARLDAQRQPVVRIVAPEVAETAPAGEYCVPGGAFLSEGHAWARIEPGGQIRVGIDDFARKALGPVEAVEVPEPGRAVHKGDVLFTLKGHGQAVHFASPLSGKVLKANPEIQAHPDPLLQSPYDRGWVCALQATDLLKELDTLKIGKPVVPWYQEEIKRLRELAPAPGTGPDWPAVEEAFLHPQREVVGA